MSAELQPKPTNRFQAQLIELKTSIRLLEDVLSEAKKLFSIAEACFGPLEKLILRAVLLGCTVISALQLVGVKVDLPAIGHWGVSLFKHLIIR